MMLSCKDISHKLSESCDRTLSLTERISVRAHLMMCGACRIMEKQMKIIRVLSQQTDERSSQELPSLPNDSRTRILGKLKEAIKK